MTASGAGEEGASRRSRASGGPRPSRGAGPSASRVGSGSSPAGEGSGSAGGSAPEPGPGCGSPLLAGQRQARILARLESRGGARIGELARWLGVSVVTVRRDLAALEDAGLLGRVRGGALRPAPVGEPVAGVPAHALADDVVAGSAVSLHGVWNGHGSDVRGGAEAEATALAAASLVTPGTTVGLCGGRGLDLLARHLLAVPGLTVVTNSVPAYRVLTGTPDGPALLLTGGTRDRSGALVGPLAVAALAEVRLDIAFVAPDGVDPYVGLTAADAFAAEVAREFVDRADRVAALVDRRVWGRRALAELVPLDAVDLLVADEALAAEVNTALPERTRAAVLAAPPAAA